MDKVRERGALLPGNDKNNWGNYDFLNGVWREIVSFNLAPEVENTLPIPADFLLTTFRGGTDLERGYGDVRPPFHAIPAARKGPISSKRVSSQDPLLRKFGNFSLNSLNFHPNFSSQAPNLEIFGSQAPKFGNFQLTSPQIWKFSAHKPPFSEANVSSQAPHFGNPGRTPLPEKSWVPPRDYIVTNYIELTFSFLFLFWPVFKSNPKRLRI